MATPLVLSNVGKLAENIISANFRNEAHFTISKNLRKKAYTQCLDVMIGSIDYNLYENFNANPSIKHYGYIQLVFQDAFSRTYPITQFRQRFLDVRQEQAIQMWKDWIKFYQQEYYFYIGEEQRNQLATAANVEDFVDSGFNPLTRSQFIGEQGWIELPLREVHVKMLKNCSFSIDYAQWEPIPFNELWSGLISITGESQMVDGDKDDGIPDNSEPTQNSPSDPWQGTINPDSDLSLAGKGLNPVNTGDWDNDPNSDRDWAFGFTFVYANELGDFITVQECTERLTLRGKITDSLTVQYSEDPIGITRLGEPCYAVRLIWQGSIVPRETAGFRAGSYQQCSRREVF